MQRFYFWKESNLLFLDENIRFSINSKTTLWFFLFEIIPLFVITSTKTKLQSNFNLQNFWKKRFIVLVFVSSFFITHSFDRRVFCSYKIFCIKKWLFYVYSELFVHIFFSFYVLCMLFTQLHRKPIIYRFAVHFGLALFYMNSPLPYWN